MNVQQILDLLQAHPGARVRFLLPGGGEVPPHAHATEVGRVRKDFVDCGGTRRDAEACVLQLWLDDDDPGHRLPAGKLAGIFASAAATLGLPEHLLVEVEHDAGPGVITQSRLVEAEAEADATEPGGRLTLRLEAKRTACLAPELCGPVEPGAGDACCGGGGRGGCGPALRVIG